LSYIKDSILTKNISEKTIQDLEFNTVLQHVLSYSNSDLGRDQILAIRPIRSHEELSEELQRVNEYLSSFISANKIPNHHFENISKEVGTLKIENSFLDAAAFLKIATVSETVNELLLFFKKFSSYFPRLHELSEEIEFTTSIPNEIHKIITSYGEVANTASPILKQIRKEISNIRGKIGESFNRDLSKYSSLGFLDTIRESVIDNHRVLAVLAMHRRKVKGTFLGSSKSGNIVYIAPQATLNYDRELQNLVFEEEQEVIKILKQLAERIRPFTPILVQYLSFLSHLDCIAAKAKYAKDLNAVLPIISTKKKIDFKQSYHPILWRKNKAQGLETIPQSILLNEKQQIIVISGPNAGGKSITLKTIGLLQLMLQSGLLIPVDERSETYIFDTILTDIGDNQSIENQLSTYSYRLKNMRAFLRKCNKETLFLIDEFGTGSDPELGGALAEIFLEEFHSKEAFGIITTHYSNLKVLANELPNVTNANMQFNEKTLDPLYKLYIGQAGSSFTFEVAQKNGIPFSLINKAKKRVETEKIRLDKTISKLQQERNRLQKNSDNLEKQQTKGKAHIDSLQEKEQKIQDKLADFQELYDSNQKMLSIGRKMNELLNHFFQTNNKKELNSNLQKWIAAEKTKHLKKNPIKPVTKNEKKIAQIAEKQQKEVFQKVEKEILAKVVEVRKKKKVEDAQVAKEKANYIFKIGDRVRLIDGNAVGSVDKIEKQNIFINYGLFTTKAKIEQLELVEKGKK